VERWRLLKDILLTGTGVAVILSQVLSLHPSGLLLGTGLALTVPTIADHVRGLLPSSPGDGHSLPSTQPQPLLPSPTSPEGESAGERRAE
jgi:hypothetical protein